jgi:hypothetical protein
MDTENTEALAQHLDAVHSVLTRHIVFPSPEAADAATLWVVQAHLVREGAFDSTPRLAVVSPEKGSGKTRVLELLELLVPEPLLTVNVSAAAVFRIVENKMPTLLMDESDTFLGPNIRREHEDIRGLVNAGHRRGASALRCVGEGTRIAVKEFPAFCAVALAAIGELPDTILSRSVVIKMKRRRPDEVVASFRRRAVEPETRVLRESIAAWSKAHVDMFNRRVVELPDGITDRPADVWEPLVSIGDVAGERWSLRARSACISLNKVALEEAASLGVRCLADCRKVFREELDKVSSADLVDLLNALEEAPWSDLAGQPLNPTRLAHLLKPYDVKPSTLRFAGKVMKGYRRGAFHDAWQRYLPPACAEADTSVTAATTVAEPSTRQPTDRKLESARDETDVAVARLELVFDATVIEERDLGA